MTTLTLYAITDAKPKRALGKQLRSLKLGKAWVVVGRNAPLEATPEALVAYDRVIRSIALDVRALLPFRFGSTARDEDDLATLLAPFAASIERALARARDAVQFTLRVHGSPPKPRRTKTSKRKTGTAWLEERREALRVHEIDPVTERTTRFVRDTRSERKARGDHIATVYHLVPKKNVKKWWAAVEEGSRLLQGVTLTTSGPWPPYAFAELP